MRRRDVINSIFYIAAAWSLPAAAQHAKNAKKVGVLIQGGPHHLGVEGLRYGLKAAGLEEGRDFELVVVEAKGDLKSVEAAAHEFERDKIDVIVGFSTSVSLAAKRSTSKVPIVFAAGSDPVAFGLVESIAKPGSRLTGVHTITTDLTAKRLEILSELMPGLRRVVTFFNPENRMARSAMDEAREAARALGIDFLSQEVASPEDVRERTFSLESTQADAYFFVSDSMVITQDSLIVEAATRLGLATMGYELDIVRKGALVGYGVNYREFGRRVANHVSRILAGAEAGDLPVEALELPALAINLKTAKQLGIEVPATLIGRAEEVIE